MFTKFHFPCSHCQSESAFTYVRFVQVDVEETLEEALNFYEHLDEEVICPVCGTTHTAAEIDDTAADEIIDTLILAPVCTPEHARTVVQLAAVGRIPGVR